MGNTHEGLRHRRHRRRRPPRGPSARIGGSRGDGIARSPAKAEQLRSDGGQPVEVSIFDAAALAEAFAGSDAVVNLASAIPPVTKFMSAKAWAANDRVRREGSTAIVDAALSAAVDRVLQESVVMLYPDGGDSWIDETTPADRFPLAEANLAAEANTERFGDGGGTGVVLRFGWFYGPGATHSEQFFALARRHVCVQMGRPKTYVSSIHVADAGTAVEAALRVPAGTTTSSMTSHSPNAPMPTPLPPRPCPPVAAVPGPFGVAARPPNHVADPVDWAGNRRFKEAAGWAPSYPSASEGWQAMAAGLTTG